MPKYNRKQTEAAIELARLTANRLRPELQTTQLLRLMADQLESCLSLFDRALRGATSSSRERELSQVLGLNVGKEPLVSEVFLDDDDFEETSPEALRIAR